MSPTIWTRCGGRRNTRRLRLDAWRVVEAQHVSSTRKLVQSSAEQEVLEALIDGVKPPVPEDVRGLHYLLSTPFRHPPLRNGSRFGTRLQRGIFYAAREVPTALAEVAYYRLVFRAGTDAQLGLTQTEHTAFRVSLDTRHGVDLTRPPFDTHAARISSPTDYAPTQALGTAMREDGVALALFTSARDPRRGTNVAVFAPCFSADAPHPDWQTWTCVTSDALVELRRRNPLGPTEALSFPRAGFLVDGVLPAPAV